MTVTGMSALSEYERAQIFFEMRGPMRDPAQAARLLEPVAEQEPRNVSVRLLLARAYHSAQLRRAEAEFRAVPRGDPSRRQRGSRDYPFRISVFYAVACAARS